MGLAQLSTCSNGGETVEIRLTLAAVPSASDPCFGSV